MIEMARLQIEEYKSGMEDGFMDMAGIRVAYINTSHGFQNIVEKGDYIITHIDGHRQAVPASVLDTLLNKLKDDTCHK